MLGSGMADTGAGGGAAVAAADGSAVSWVVGGGVAPAEMEGLRDWVFAGESGAAAVSEDSPGPLVA